MKQREVKEMQVLLQKVIEKGQHLKPYRFDVSGKKVVIHGYSLQHAFRSLPKAWQSVAVQTGGE